MKIKKSITALTLGTLATIGAVGSTTTVFAAAPQGTTTSTSNESFTSGGLFVYSPPGTVAFPALTLDGDVQSTTSPSFQIDVVDATGTGGGWKLSVSASRLTEVLPNGQTGSLQLPLNSLSIGVPTVAASYTQNGEGKTTSQSPGISIQGPTVIDSGASVKLASASTTQGMGAYLFSFPGLTLSANPATITEDTTNYPNGGTPFSTTLTWTVATGP